MKESDSAEPIAVSLEIAPPLGSRPQITGNAGLYFVSWQLSRRGWHVLPTVRNARGSDLIVTDSDETIYFGVQSKALSKRHPVPLGRDLAGLRSDWWIITINANSDHPTCFIMTRDEVQRLAFTDQVVRTDKGPAHWLQPKVYDQPEYQNAWHRLDMLRMGAHQDTVAN